MILAFDLDDTLYEEITYVHSGFQAVSKYLVSNGIVNINQQKLYDRFIEELNSNGRGKVFNVVLDSLDIKQKKVVNQCLSVYRLHNPKIKLSKSAIECLNRFEKFKKYLVTDGNKIVQQKKIDALKLNKFFEKTYRTYQYGIKYSKPSTYCFELILKREKCLPYELVYIGDNPNKDFVNLKKMGVKTIRINQGMFKDFFKEKKYEADIMLDSLDELTLDLIRKIALKK